MSNAKKKNRRLASKSNLEAASKIALEAMESRLLMSGSVAFSYVTDKSEYDIPAGGTATVKVYLLEALSGGAGSIIDSSAENGLVGAGFMVNDATPPSNASTITGITPDATDFAGTQIPNQNSPNEADLVENTGSTQANALTGNSGAPSNEVYLGSLTITGGSGQGTTTFSLGEYNSFGGNTVTGNDTDLDQATGVSLDGTSYAGAGPVTNTFTVVTTLPLPTVNVTAPNMVYNGNAYAAETSSVTNDPGATETYSFFTGTLNATQVASATPLGSAPSDAGTYTIEANFAGDSSYSAGSGIANFSITQATPTLTANAPNSGTFTGSAFTATATDIGVGSATLSSPTPTLVYTDISAGNTTSATAPTDPGTYSVVASVVASTDYTAASSSNSATFTISAATPTVNETAPASGPYTGSSFTATATVTGVGNATLAETPTFVYTDISTGNTTSSTAPTNAGSYSVVASVAASTDYAAASSSAETFTIAQSTPSVTANAPTSGTYTGSPFTATATVTGSTVTPTFVYTDTSAGNTTSSTAPTAVGTYSVVASVAASGNSGAASSTNSATFSISQATPTVNVTVNGAGNSFSTTITGVSGTPGSTLEGVGLTLTYYSGSTATGTPLSGPPTVSGTYTVVATFAGSADYAAVTTAGVSNTGTYTYSSGAPAFAQTSYAFTANETVYSYAFVGSVLATPAFPTQTISYSLSGTDAGKFEIGVASGRIQAVNPLLLTGQTNFSFNVVASASTATHIPVAVTVPVTVHVTGVQPTITDYYATVALKDNTTDYPLNGVYVADPTIAPNRTNDVVTVTMPVANGSLADPTTLATRFVGTLNGSTETYTYTGTATGATTALHYLKYTPAQHEIAPGSSYATLFTVSASNAAVTTAANTATTTVNVTAANTVPTLTGVVLAQSMTDSSPEVAKTVFGSATVTDPDDGSTTFGTGSFTGQHETVTVRESNAALGTLSGGGFTGSGGLYTFTGTAAQVTTALRALQFTATPDKILSGYPQTEDLTIGVTDAAGGRASTSSDYTALKITPVGRLAALHAALTYSNLGISGGVKPSHGISVVTLTGVDADASDVLTYSLASGGTNNADFYVSGNKLLVNLYAGLTAGTYHVTVKVADHGGDSVTQGLTITIGATAGTSSVALNGSPTIVVA